MQVSYDAADEQHARVRSFRNVLITGAVLLSMLVIAGLLLIKGDFVPGFSHLDSQGQILAHAIVFGVAQHLVTRFVDQRADDALSSVPSKERPCEGETKQSGSTAGRQRKPGFHDDRLIAKGHLPRISEGQQAGHAARRHGQTWPVQAGKRTWREAWTESPDIPGGAPLSPAGPGVRR